MKRIYQKYFRYVKDIPRNMFYALGGSPSAYWGWLLVFFGLFFIGVAAFGIYFLILTNNKISERVILPEEIRPLDVDRDELAEAMEILDQRAQEYSGVILAPAVPDPSL